MSATLLEGERLDEVNDRLSLIQKTDGLTFGTDALLLAAFIRKKGNTAIELGGGSGIISLLLAARERFSLIRSAEIQPEYAELIRRNAALNGLEDKLVPVCADVRDHTALGPLGSFDAVFSNPPYMTTGCGYACAEDAKNIARHEVNGDIGDFATAAAALLKYGGAFYVVYRTERMADLFTAARAVKLEPKRMTLVHARASLPPSMLLAEFRLGGKCGLTVTRPLILTENNSNTADYDYLLNNGILPNDF
ncbi:MAG: methyltransferase [Clostridia bacterium]|nr:methyltransferase [Clostridia bacterium]